MRGAGRISTLGRGPHYSRGFEEIHRASTDVVEGFGISGGRFALNLVGAGLAKKMIES